MGKNPYEVPGNMKRITVAVSVVLLLAAMAMAQASSGSSGQTGANSQAATSQGSSQSNAKSQAKTSQNNGTFALPENRTKLGGNDASARISREVMHELLMDPYYSVFDNLAYRVDGNTVTLMGSVVNQRVKDDAVASVKKIEGVDKVNDQIDVLPPSPMDDQIRRAAYRAIFGADGLSRYSMGAVPPIHIIVKNGHMQLVGVVDSEADKNQAGIRANSVPNVFSVENNLQVVPSS
jgi:hyperosmotically inducible protein